MPTTRMASQASTTKYLPPLSSQATKRACMVPGREEVEGPLSGGLLASLAPTAVGAPMEMVGATTAEWCMRQAKGQACGAAGAKGGCLGTGGHHGRDRPRGAHQQHAVGLLCHARIGAGSGSWDGACTGASPARRRSGRGHNWVHSC